MTTPFNDDEEIRLLVTEFEKCTLDPTTFRHYQHLAVALWYVAHYPYETASEKMRTGIQKLAASHGKMGYHETITVFWLRLVRSFIAGARGEKSITVLANRLAAGENKDRIYEYYSTELLNSDMAKREWIEPDLKPLPAVATSSARRPASQPASAE